MPYATVSDLEAWLAPDPAPDNAVRLLVRASTAIDRALYGLAYDRDDPDVQAVLRAACVQQTHWMIDRGDETGAQDDLQSMSTAGRSFTRRPVGDGAGSTPRLAQSAADVLITSGYFYGFAWVVG
ncbi:hypothetical protein [Streptomyces sp. SID10815]|uniref:hypothetical protein n=1 Tax=Streptomyces sp. SID10815 TaxID=2706027 RepID=UPI0013CB190D|nr:hypothetical protein [Streptomyces sp. SID10815]NEA52423.1 hypothetical protein [Streptomyces sp. SID10815]